MTPDEKYEELGFRYAKALEESMKQTMEDVCNRIEKFKELTPIQQEYVKMMALINVSNNFGGSKKKAKKNERTV